MLFKSVSEIKKAIEQLNIFNVVLESVPNADENVHTPACLVMPLNFQASEINGKAVKFSELVTINVIVRKGEFTSGGELLLKCIDEVLTLAIAGYSRYPALSQNNPVNSVDDYDVFTAVFELEQIFHLTKAKEVI